MRKKIQFAARFYGLVVLLTIAAFVCRAQEDKDLPPRPQPTVLVNDLANTMSPDQVAALEAKLDNYAQTSSTQVAVVTIKNLGDYDVADYTVRLFNKWGVGQKDKNNGVMILAAIENHKIHISTGGGVQGVLTDAICGSIIRNEMAPSFKVGNYFEGFSKGVDSVISATKGEYVGTAADAQGGSIPSFFIIFFIIIIYAIISGIIRQRRGGGTYIGGGGFGSFGAGWIIGDMLGGGNRGGDGGGDGGGGGFGGFGGGSSDGGGASGGW